MSGYLADYHTHSRISPDAGTSMREMAEAAGKAGLNEICFTDHMEPSLWGTYDLKPLRKEFEEARKACGDRIVLKLGIELGEAPRDFAIAERMLREAPDLDFVIGSIHSLSKAYGYESLYFMRETGADACRREIADYLTLVLALAKWGKFSVLGHLTLPLRYLKENLGVSMTFDGFEEPVAEIFRALIQNGCGIELNTNRGHEPLPGEKWLRLYRDLGGEIITLGSDAHTTRYVGCAIREGQELLKACGYPAFCTFEKKQPVFHSL